MSTYQPPAQVYQPPPEYYFQQSPAQAYAYQPPAVRVGESGGYGAYGGLGGFGGYGGYGGYGYGGGGCYVWTPLGYIWAC